MELDLDAVEETVARAVERGSLEVESEFLDKSFESLLHRFRQVRGGRPGSPEEIAAHLCPSSWTFAAKYWSSSGVQFLSLSLTDGFRISLYLFAHWSSFRPSMRRAIHLSTSDKLHATYLTYQSPSKRVPTAYEPQVTAHPPLSTNDPSAKPDPMSGTNVFDSPTYP
jgi:hypothetical protein